VNGAFDEKWIGFEAFDDCSRGFEDVGELLRVVVLEMLQRMKLAVQEHLKHSKQQISSKLY
jgi:hypothetical protein